MVSKGNGNASKKAWLRTAVITELDYHLDTAGG
jgi:hypothetical protein